jgi:hypothetical protein
VECLNSVPNQKLLSSWSAFNRFQTRSSYFHGVPSFGSKPEALIFMECLNSVPNQKLLSSWSAFNRFQTRSS